LAGIEHRPCAPDGFALVAYFQGERDQTVYLQERLGGIDGLTVASVDIPEVDWVQRFREGFRAFAVGRFWITPPWDIPAPATMGTDAIPLLIDPGRAFGTGTHESTRLCMRILQDLVLRSAPQRVIDIGAGTGILAMAATRLWPAASVVASDFDPEAVAQARITLAHNQSHIPLCLADGARPFLAHCFDLAIANISAPLLIERRDELCALLRPQGLLLLSGLLIEDRAAVLARFQPLTLAQELADGEWCALLLER
ncbi:MAG: 50S ribosomal protein L11 methyltransferase, partial [Vicinamibacteria bacterium]|nr:50S ribosomal protein L11 methyltransferase [Vicinamibacteria bacterium]